METSQLFYTENLYSAHSVVVNEFMGYPFNTSKGNIYV